MISVMQKARSSWLLSFGDVITLLLTFFIVVVVMNNSQGSKIDEWVERQLTDSYLQLETELTNNQFEFISVQREARGILLTIRGDSAFEKGAFEPSVNLNTELTNVGSLLPKVKVLQLETDSSASEVILKAGEDGYQWHTEVAVLGHTDNDWVNPESRLRNNFFLSTLRAEQVAQILKLASNLKAEKFSITGYGEWQPIYSNATQQGKDQNRRVEILITAGFKKLDI